MTKLTDRLSPDQLEGKFEKAGLSKKEEKYIGEQFKEEWGELKGKINGERTGGKGTRVYEFRKKLDQLKTHDPESGLSPYEAMKLRKKLRDIK